jgi:hypothetical protein
MDIHVASRPFGNKLDFHRKPLPPRLPLGMAKPVEFRRRARIDHARALTMNNETQKDILDQIRLYNLDGERHRLQKRPRVGHGRVARDVHDEQMGVVQPPAQPSPMQVEYTRSLLKTEKDIADIREDLRTSAPAKPGYHDFNWMGEGGEFDRHAQRAARRVARPVRLDQRGGFASSGFHSA